MPGKVVASLIAMTMLSMVSVPHARAADLIHVEVVGLHNSTGQVGCNIYSTADGFPNNASKALKSVTAPIEDKKAVCDFKAIAEGNYAVAVMHDENLDGKLDRNDMGIPSEGVGASNDAKGVMGPPKFKDASFDYGGGRKDLTVHMDYLLEMK